MHNLLSADRTGRGARNAPLGAIGGYNHYQVANHLAAHPISLEDMDVDTLDHFERIFQVVNQLYPSGDE